MSKLSDLQSRMRALQDIEEILNAMKNLSLVEITKISRFYVTQQELLHSVERALADFQQFYGAPSIAEGPTEDSLYVLIGSERGFCGGFNETILRKLESETSSERPARLILVADAAHARRHDQLPVPTAPSATTSASARPGTPSSPSSTARATTAATAD